MGAQPRPSFIGHARLWRERGDGMCHRFSGMFLRQECICIMVIDACERRRDLTYIENKPFLRRWLRLCEPEILRYVQKIAEDANWTDLKFRIRSMARRTAYTTPAEFRKLAIERLVIIGGTLAELKAVGQLWQHGTEFVPLPDPDPTPDTDQDGSGGEGSGGGAGSKAAPVKPSPEASTGGDGLVIELTEDELAALLDNTEMPTFSGGML